MSQMSWLIHFPPQLAAACFQRLSVAALYWRPLSSSANGGKAGEIKKIEHHLLVAIVGPSIRVIKRNGPFPRSHLFCVPTSKSKAIMKATSGRFVFLIPSSSPVSSTQSTIWRALIDQMQREMQSSTWPLVYITISSGSLLEEAQAPNTHTSSSSSHTLFLLYLCSFLSFIHAKT